MCGSLLIQSGEWLSKDEKTPDEYCIYGKQGEQYLVDANTIGQYTGIMCKTGKVFEGDIYTWTMEYDDYDAVKVLIGEYQAYSTGNKSYGVYGENLNGKQFSIYQAGFANIEISGNVYDNPELLKGK